MTWLKQSTAATIVLGPFVDDTDGVSAETSLTISQADVRLSKNGGAFAQKNDATSATHMENGYYSCPLNTTDTNTLGRLRVAVSESGALPVWVDFMVVTAQVWDSLFGADRLQVDVRELGDSNLALTSQMKADVNAEADTALSDYDPPTNAEMNARTLPSADYFDPVHDTVAAVTTVGSVTGNVGGNVAGSVASVTGAVGSVTGNIGGNVAGSVGSVTGDVTVGTNKDKTGYSLVAAPPTAVQVRQEMDSNSTQLAAIKASTDNLPASPAATGDAMTLTAAYDAAKSAAQAGDKMDIIDSPNATAVSAVATGVWSAGTRTITGGSLTTPPPTAADIRSEIDSNSTQLAAIKSSTDNLPEDPAGVSDLPDISGLATSVEISALNDVSLADIADAVWDEALSGHLDAGSTGAGLNAAGSAGDPWATALPGAYGAGSAGNILGSRLDAAITTRAAAATALTNATWTPARAALLDHLDAAITSRLASAGYTAPDNAGITTLLDRLTALRAGYLDKLNVAGTLAHSDAANTYKADVSALATSAAIDALDLLIDAIKAKTDNLPEDPAGVSDLPDTPDLTALSGDVTAIKVKTDQMVFTVANKVDATAEATVDEGAIAEAVIDGMGDLVADIWSYSPRTLTQAAVIPEQLSTAEAITRRRGDTWEIALTGLALDSPREVWFTMKRGYGYPDADATLQVVASNGLARVNGVAVDDGSAAGLTVSEDGETLTISVAAAITAQLATGQFVYDVQWQDASDAIYTASIGTFTVSSDVTRAIS